MGNIMKENKIIRYGLFPIVSIILFSSAGASLINKLPFDFGLCLFLGLIIIKEIYG
jgi:hypothetical protein